MGSGWTILSNIVINKDGNVIIRHKRLLRRISWSINALLLLLGSSPCLCGIAFLLGITDPWFPKGAEIYAGSHFAANWVLVPRSADACITSNKKETDATCNSGSEYCNLSTVEPCDPYISYVDCVVSDSIKFRIVFYREHASFGESELGGTSMVWYSNDNGQKWNEFVTVSGWLTRPSCEKAGHFSDKVYWITARNLLLLSNNAGISWCAWNTQMLSNDRWNWDKGEIVQIESVTFSSASRGKMILSKYDFGRPEPKLILNTFDGGVTWHEN